MAQFFGIERREGETDEELRERIRILAMGRNERQSQE